MDNIISRALKTNRFKKMTGFCWWYCRYLLGYLRPSRIKNPSRVLSLMDSIEKAKSKHGVDNILGKKYARLKLRAKEILADKEALPKKSFSIEESFLILRLQKKIDNGENTDFVSNLISLIENTKTIEDLNDIKTRVHRLKIDLESIGVIDMININHSLLWKTIDFAKKPSEMPAYDNNVNYNGIHAAEITDKRIKMYSMEISDDSIPIERIRKISKENRDESDYLYYDLAVMLDNKLLDIFSKNRTFKTAHECFNAITRSAARLILFEQWLDIVTTSREVSLAFGTALSYILNREMGEIDTVGLCNKLNGIYLNELPKNRSSYKEMYEKLTWIPTIYSKQIPAYDIYRKETIQLCLGEISKAKNQTEFEQINYDIVEEYEELRAAYDFKQNEIMQKVVSDATTRKEIAQIIKKSKPSDSWRNAAIQKAKLLS